MRPIGAQAPITRAASGEVMPRDDRSFGLDDLLDSGGESSASANGAAASFSLIALLRYKWSMIAMFLLIAGVAIPAIWILVVPLYQAQAVIRVSPVGTKIMFSTENNGMVPFYNSFLNTQVNIIRSREVLDRVLDDPLVQATEWYRNPPQPMLKSPLKRMELLRDALMARPRRSTELIDVSMSARDGQDARLIVDTVVDEYLQITTARLEALDRDRLGTLRDERDWLAKQISDGVERRNELAMRINTSDPAARLTQANDLLLQLKAERSGLQRERQLADDELKDMPDPGSNEDEAGSRTNEESQEESPEPGEAEIENLTHSSPRFFTDAEWRGLQTTVAGARHALESGRRQYGPSHPRITALARNIEYAENLLKTREQQLIEQWKESPFGVPDARLTLEDGAPPPSRTLLKRRKRLLTRSIEARNPEIKVQEEAVKKIGEIAKKVALIDENLSYKREIKNMRMKRAEELELEQNAPARISIAGKAVAPSRPSKDRRAVFSAMAFFAAVGAALGLGYVRVIADQRVHEVGELRRTTTVPFLGQLPTLPATQELLPSCTPAIMEDVRMVRTALLERISVSGGSAILVTSSTPQAGKTSVSILLAQSLAALGKRTLLVEADLRNPTLAVRLNINGRAGLMTVLTGRTPDDVAIVTRTKKFDFDVITAGELPDDFTPDLFANGAMANALSRWKRQYDVILVDSPPVLPVADGRILGGLCDGTMMVMRSAHCRRADLIESYALLAAGGCTLLGTVLVGGTRPASYSAYYGPYGGGGENGSSHRRLEAAPTEEKKS